MCNIYLIPCKPVTGAAGTPQFCYTKCLYLYQFRIIGLTCFPSESLVKATPELTLTFFILISSIHVYFLLACESREVSFLNLKIYTKINFKTIRLACDGCSRITM